MPRNERSVPMINRTQSQMNITKSSQILFDIIPGVFSKQCTPSINAWPSECRVPFGSISSRMDFLTTRRRQVADWEHTRHKRTISRKTILWRENIIPFLLIIKKESAFVQAFYGWKFLTLSAWLEDLIEKIIWCFYWFDFYSTSLLFDTTSELLLSSSTKGIIQTNLCAPTKVLINWLTPIVHVSTIFNLGICIGRN